MKISVLAGITVLLLTAPAIAQPDSCFMPTSDGRRISMGKLCQGGKTQQSTSTAVVVGGTIRVDSVSIAEGKNDILKATGTVTNISNQRQFVGFVGVVIYQKGTRQKVGDAFLSSGTGKWLKPGESTKIETFVLRNSVEGLNANELILVPSTLN